MPPKEASSRKRSKSNASQDSSSQEQETSTRSKHARKGSKTNEEDGEEENEDAVEERADEVKAESTDAAEAVDDSTETKETEQEVYRGCPKSKDSLYTTEYWTNNLSSGKNVTVLHVQQWDDGIFTIELDEAEKEEILGKDHIILNDCGASIEETSMGWFFETKIKNEGNYSDEEKREIHKLMYCDKDNEDEYQCGDVLDFNEFEQDIMEANDWSMDDTIYEIMDGCELEIIS